MTGGLLWLLLPLASLLPLSAESTCVSAAGCSGCGSSAVNCPAISLTEFPNISAEDAALVQSLDLSYNRLTTITATDLLHYTQLQELTVTDNEITHVEEGSFSNNQHLSTLSLENNPILCDCGLRWFLEFLDSLESPETAGECESPAQLAGTLLSNLTLTQLTCDCSPECDVNSSCNVSFGTCECNPGYMGDNCSQICFPGTYGSKCAETCTCEVGSCHHITGDCSCPQGHLGANCSHDCTGAPDCVLLGRERCSLLTPENSCGAYKAANATLEGWGNSSCNTATTNTVYISPSSSTYSLSSAVSTLEDSGNSSLSSAVSLQATESIGANATGTPSSSAILTRHQLIIILSSVAAVHLVFSLIVILTIYLCWRKHYRKMMKVSPSGKAPSPQDTSFYYVCMFSCTHRT